MKAWVPFCGSWTGGGIMHELLLPVNELRSQKPIVACPPTGYFHWLFEIMPNILHVLSKVPEGKILISTKSPNYVLNALELLIGHEKYKSKIIVSRHPLKIANLIMPQVEVYSGFVNPKDIEKLRIDFRGKVDKTEDNTTGFYYISRSQTKKRKLSNEIELEQRLKDLGFKIIYAEDMLFRDQIICFLKARFIIGPHGAGLSNMIWANSPCEINEIFPFGVFNDCYARLAVTLGFGYDYISCEQDKNGVGYIPIDEIIKKIQIKLNGFM